MQNRIEQLVGGKSPAGADPQLGNQLGVAVEKASDQFQNLTRQMGEGIARHPLISLGVGLAIGATLGWFLKRK